MSWLNRFGPRGVARTHEDTWRPRSLLVTGSAGTVAGLVLPLLRSRGFEIRLADRAGSGDDRVDLCDAAACDHVVTGVEGIVHLAGASREGTVETLYADNTAALANLLRSAVRARVPNLVFASTMHVMGMYRRDERFDESSAPRPDSYYAASKLHGEALCRLFHEKAGLAVTCLRLGSVTAAEKDADPGAWISPEDVVALVEIGLRLTAPAFEIFHAVADYQGSPLPASRAALYGYRCSRPAGSYAAAMQKVQAWWHSDERARTHRGASIASAGLIE